MACTGARRNVTNIHLNGATFRKLILHQAEMNKTMNIYKNILHNMYFLFLPKDQILLMWCTALLGILAFNQNKAQSTLYSRHHSKPALRS